MSDLERTVQIRRDKKKWEQVRERIGSGLDHSANHMAFEDGLLNIYQISTCWTSISARPALFNQAESWHEVRHEPKILM